MQSAAATWTIGLTSFVAELAICGYMVHTMRLAYAPGEGTFLLGVIPAVLLLLALFQLVQLASLWSLGAFSRAQYNRAIALQIMGSVLGLGGLWLALEGGPHVAPFFVLWALLLQLAAIWLARRMFTTGERSTAEDQ
jgi:hypothetical protein